MGFLSLSKFFNQTIEIVYINNINENRKQVRNAMQKIDPEGVAMRGRAFATSQRRKEYFVKGPNQVFSIDGHDKLSRFGFEIYGAIDAYSRYVVWCYVGISNLTAVSVNKQYLRLIRHTLHMPKLIRSDKGNYYILYPFAKQAKYLLIIYLF